MDTLDSLMSNLMKINMFLEFSLFSLIDETANNVAVATEKVNKILSHSSQLKVQLSKKQELHSRETSIALKQTAENLIHLISNNTKENADVEVIATPFLEFVGSYRLFFVGKHLTIVSFRNPMPKAASLSRTTS